MKVLWISRHRPKEPESQALSDLLGGVEIVHIRYCAKYVGSCEPTRYSLPRCCSCNAALRYARSLAGRAKASGDAPAYTSSVLAPETRNCIARRGRVGIPWV